MKRRNFLVFSALGITSVAIPIWYYKYRPLSYDGLILEPEYLSYIMDGQSIYDLGSLYLEQTPGERSERELLSLLPAQDETSNDALLAEIRKDITVDYENDDVICIDGWILSKTEARQCALFSLNHKS
ncbi:MAG: hypothetical protein WBN13_10950 [Robiginitalea sp.]|uniref:hypothetical protein n=1 Tax=Robiginitalea sp. TaxID=1902411 RepID=UPI003C70670A